MGPSRRGEKAPRIRSRQPGGHQPVGALVARHFNGRLYTGRCVGVTTPETDDEADRDPWFTVVYDDGDREDLSRQDVERGIAKHVSIAAAAASASRRASRGLALNRDPREALRLAEAAAPPMIKRRCPTCNRGFSHPPAQIAHSKLCKGVFPASAKASRARARAQPPADDDVSDEDDASAPETASDDAPPPHGRNRKRRSAAAATAAKRRCLATRDTAQIAAAERGEGPATPHCAEQTDPHPFVAPPRSPRRVPIKHDAGSATFVLTESRRNAARRRSVGLLRRART